MKANLSLFLALLGATLSSTSRCAAESGYSGLSTLGTLDQQHLPRFLRDNPLPHGSPWGTRGGPDDDPTNPPNTGVTRSYHFTISRALAAPDGFLRPMILINGQFPGPMIEANWGDEIQVTISNNITEPEEGTSIHWHGLLQRATPWMDGVPSLTQCPIAPGSTFTYRFVADSYGTSWYHSHYSAQFIDGIFGPIVIYGPSHADYDEDLGVVLLQDYLHLPYEEYVEHIMSTNATLQVQPTDNTLINGKMPYNCSQAPLGSTCTPKAPYAKFRVRNGKTYKLRLVNSGGGSIIDFSIDNHLLTITANDFVDIEPYNTTIVTLGAGQRSDITFTARGNGTVWMRATIFGHFCSRPASPAAGAALGVVIFDHASKDSIPTTSAWPLPVDDGQCANEPLNKTIPYHPMSLPEPSVTYNVTIDSIVNATGHKVYRMNGNQFQGDYNDPVLLLAEQKNYSYPTDPKWNVVNFGTNTSIRVNVYNNSTGPHPMHLHGHDFWVLHVGAGQWDGTSITNPQNPQRRDTQNMGAFGHLVIQFNADNPGTWAFHCHIALHLSQGLFMTFLERPADINQLQIPQVMAQTCTDWDAYSSKNVVDVIDSGV